MSTLLSATWNRRPLTAKSSVQRGRVVGFGPIPPVHAVEATASDGQRTTLCGIDATGMYVWTRVFEHVPPSQRCDECEDRRPRLGAVHVDLDAEPGGSGRAG